ncbi:alpha-tocopherol transfer protein-like [Melitaea cinxia]|uniref:alpha-tocopherol transfer protein-like n=1 Tax=Melitaea cinxia TaxID=113334 RepID=UPI001E2718C5|nr:alpha-tocopherol transfer protein-like [Melitaea cinxia]
MATKPEDSKKYIEQLREWVNRQPHLPKDLSDVFLLRFAHSCFYDVEKAKKAMEIFFSIRGNSPDLLNNRDPESPHIQKILNVINIGLYRSATSNRWLWFWQINDPGLEQYEYLLDVKLFFLSTDAHFLDQEVLSDEDIVVMDVKDITLKFLTKINLSIQRRLSKYQQEGMPIRLKQIHVINAPPFIDKIYGALKPFVKKEITEMIYFHPPKSDSIYKHLSKEDLPADYGGTRPFLAEYNKEIMELLIKHRETLIREDFWRPSKGNSSTEVGSFRTLAID